MLGDNASSLLLSLLDEHSIPFESMMEKLNTTFAKTDHFNVGSSVFLLLQNRILSLGARLNAYYLLFDLYKSEPLSCNPFLPSFLMPLSPQQFPRPPTVEISFLAIILSGKALVVAKRTAMECVKGLEPKAIPNFDPHTVLKAYDFRKPSIVSAFSKIGLTPPVLDDTEDIAMFRSDSAPAANTSLETARNEALQKLLATNTFEPRYIRPPPPLLEPSSNELIWINPEEERLPLWIHRDESLELLQQSLQKALPPDTIELVRKIIQKDLKKALGVFIPLNLPCLVKNNVKIAAEVLQQILSSSHASDYFSALSKVPVSPNAVATVSELSTTSQTEIPGEFIQTFITNAIYTCQDVKDANRNKLIKYTCILLTRINEKGKTKLTNLLPMINDFCLEHVNLKVAAELYKALSTKEQKK